MQDPIADMLTRLRNSLLSSKKTVCVPFSNVLQFANRFRVIVSRFLRPLKCL